MLEQIDESLEAMLRATVPLNAVDVDVSFEPPERDWSAKLNRPTVNLFLWDIRRSADRARTGVETVERDGVLVRRMALPRIELRYLITAWTADHRDERALLGGLLRSVLANATIPEEFQARDLGHSSLPVLRLAGGDKSQFDVFKTLEGQLKPGLNLVVTAEVDLGFGRPIAPAATVAEFSFRDTSAPHLDIAASIRRVAGDVLAPDAVGLTVVSPRGAATVNAAGRFLIPAAPGDEITLLSSPELSAVVPEQGGVVIG